LTEGAVEALQEFVDNFTYLGIFAVLLLGSLGVPIPEEMPIIAAAVLSHEDIVRWWPCVARLPAGGAIRRYGALLGRPALG
jgi:membrane protein DedA with SNARE-associated domain